MFPDLIALKFCISLGCISDDVFKETTFKDSTYFIEDVESLLFHQASSKLIN